jgi:hypothetical protein
MSQQEFAPGPQQQSESEEEIVAPQYPYSWSGKANTEGVPRDEPPSSYDYDMAYQAGYQAQDAQNIQNEQSNASQGYDQASQQPDSQFTPPPPYQYNSYDGDAFEQGYQPGNRYNGQNNMNQGVPPWARPQPQAQRGPFRFGGILLLLIMISLFSGLFDRGFFLFGHIAGPFIGMMFFPILILFMILSSIFRGGRRGGGWRRRGPWGW